MAGFGALLSNLLVPLLTVGPHAWGGNAVSGYGRIALVFALVMLGTQAFVVFGVQVPKINSTPAKGHWRTITAVLKQNDQVRWTATILFVYMSVTTLASTMMPIYLYVACGYSGTNVVIFTLLGQVATALVMISFAQITNRIARKKLLSQAVVASTLGYGGILLAGVFASGSGKIWWLAGLNVLPAVGNGLFYLVLLITLANVVDYHAWRFGEQRAGIITASRPFVTKIGMALGQLGAMGAYWLTKTLTVTQKIATYEHASATGAMSVDAKQNAITGLLAQLPAGQGWGLLAIATIVPACGMVFALYMYRNHMILDEGLVEKINSVK
jgi:Na+/melibiose symporter-like transporter